MQQKHDEAKDEFERARKAVWDSKDPHEQMSNKTAKADRLRKQVTTWEKELADSLEEKEAAEAKAEACQVKIDETIDKIEDKKAEIKRLLEESTSIGEQVVGASHEGLGDLVDKHTKDTLSMFDDPLLAKNEAVRAKRPDVVHLTNAIADALQKLAQISTEVRGGLDVAKDQAAKDATAAAEEAEEKAKKSADASKAANVVRTPAQRRSPTVPGSSSSGGSSDQQRSALRSALAKPIHERNGEELVLTGRAGKFRKTDEAADDMDLSNVGC